MIFLIAVLASAAGALTRLVIDSAVKHRWATAMPWATIAINVTGSAMLGVVAGVVLFHGVPSTLQLIAGTGFCGGYTTFSSASYETVRLVERGRVALALSNAAASLLASVLGCGAGLLVANLLH